MRLHLNMPTMFLYRRPILGGLPNCVGGRVPGATMKREEVNWKTDSELGHARWGPSSWDGGNERPAAGSRPLADQALSPRGGFVRATLAQDRVLLSGRAVTVLHGRLNV